MVQPIKQRIDEEAIAWHLRLNSSDEDSWGAFAEWLEADPLHNQAYEAVCDADAALDDWAAAPRTEQTIPSIPQAVSPSARASRRWMWPAMAASIALAGFGIWAVTGVQNSDYTVTTAPGEARTVVLADGSRIALNGASEIVLDKSDTRVAELKFGEAQFSVHHDAGKPFAVHVGNQRVVDVGTVFNVRATQSSLDVEVAEGSVRYEEGVTRLRLNAGDTLHASGDALVEGSKPVAAIGSWTRGKLVYRDAPVMEVAGDLTRARGIAIELDPALSNRTFTGVIQLDGDDAELRERVARLLGQRVVQTADGWWISH